MKNLKSLVVAGMIGVGSLGIFGNKGYGQDILTGRYLSKEEIESDSILPKGPAQVRVIDLNKDKKIDHVIYKCESNEKRDSLNVEFVDRNYIGSLDFQITSIFDKKGNVKRSEYRNTSPNMLQQLKVWETLGVGEYFIDSTGTLINK